jgi:tetratricopeptide (TPR) repeat protein
MKLTRSQQIALIVLGVLTIGVYGCLVSTIVRNSRQASPASLAAAQTAEPTPSPTATVSPTPMPTPTPVPPAPQTRYDLQVAHEPENPTLRLQRGHAYIALDAPTYAIEDFRAAIEMDDTLAEAYAGRGEALFHLKEWTAAAEDFEVALALNPDLADAHAWRGYLLSAHGRHGPAIEALRQAVDLDKGDPWKHILLAQAVLRSGNTGEAKIEYTAALALENRSTEAYVGRAMAYAEGGDLEAAQADIDSARDIAPHDPVVLNGQAWLYAWYRNDRLVDAEQLGQRAVAGAEDDLEKARHLHTLGWIYYQQERYNEAVTTLEEAAALATVEGEVVYGEIVEHLEEAREALE